MIVYYWVGKHIGLICQIYYVYDIVHTENETAPFNRSNHIHANKAEGHTHAIHLWHH